MIGMKNQIFSKKYFLFIIFLLIVLLLPLSLGAAKMHGQDKHALEKFRKPYVGEYTCQSLQWGENDLLSNYKKITISLQPNGKGLLVVIPSRGKRSSQNFQYSYNFATKQLNFMLDSLTKQKLVTMPLQNGSFCILQTILNKPLYMVFEL